jgi:hypothetical protein
VWGKYDPSFQVAEVDAYRRDLPNAEVHVLGAGHFALDTAADEISALMSASFKSFLWSDDEIVATRQSSKDYSASLQDQPH